MLKWFREASRKMSQTTEKRSPSSTIPWVEKYRPPSLQDMAGFNEISLKLKKFIENFFSFQSKIKQFQSKRARETEKSALKKLDLQLKSYQAKFNKQKASLLIGPPGIGKTTVVYALAHDLKMSVVELNASDTRTKDALQEKLHETVRSTNLLRFTSQKSKNKLILIDEVDGLHGRTDRGGVSQLKSIIEESRFPIIMTCNFRDNQKFQTLYKLANPLITITPAKSSDIASILVRIAKAEQVDLSSDQIKKIATRSNGDYRAAINDLQGLAQGNLQISTDTLKNLNMARDTEANIQDLMKDLFTSETIREAKHVLDNVQSNEVDYRNIHRWISENVLAFITRKIDQKFACENLAYVDRILGYIGRTQDYQHLSYFYDILAGGIRFAKHDQKIPSKRLNPPRWFRTQAIPDDEIAATLQATYSVSLNTVMREIRPKLQYMIKYNTNIKEYLAGLLNKTEKDLVKSL